MTLNTRTKRTPCVGICSTTYGDLVCRGCKRFAHEIVQWNGYEPAQRDAVWQRLTDLQATVVSQHVLVADRAAFEVRLDEAALASSLQESTPAAQLYALLAYLAVRSERLSDAGLAQSGGEDGEALTVLKAVDGEIYTRSLAHYERNFKVPV